MSTRSFYGVGSICRSEATGFVHGFKKGWWRKAATACTSANPTAVRSAAVAGAPVKDADDSGLQSARIFGVRPRILRLRRKSRREWRVERDREQLTPAAVSVTEGAAASIDDQSKDRGRRQKIITASVFMLGFVLELAWKVVLYIFGRAFLN